MTKGTEGGVHGPAFEVESKQYMYNVGKNLAPYELQHTATGTLYTVKLWRPELLSGVLELNDRMMVIKADTAAGGSRQIGVVQ